MSAVEGEHSGVVLSAYEGGKVIDCTACGYKHVVPLPSQEHLKQFYEQEFYQSEKKEYLAASAEDAEWKQLEFSRRYTTVEKYLPKQSSRRVLDIGCGPGDFLALGKELGWQGLGVEPSPVAAKYGQGRGLSILSRFFSEELLPELGHFDFIHMSEVLEHVPNPAQILAWAWQLLEPGGVLCLSVPNDYNPLQKCLVDGAGHNPWWVVPDHHLNYFNFTSLEKLLVGQGYEALQQTTNFPMELFLLMGQNYTQDETLGRKLHGWRKNFDVAIQGQDPQLLEDIYSGLAKAGVGRLVIQFARKPLT